MILDQTNRLTGEQIFEPHQRVAQMDEKGRDVADPDAAKRQREASLRTSYSHVVQLPGQKSAGPAPYFSAMLSDVLLINPQDSAQAKQIQNTGLTYGRYQLMVQAVRSLNPSFAGALGSENNGIRDILIAVPYTQARERKLNALLSGYNSNSVGFWLDVEALAGRWKNLENMRQDVAGLPAADYILGEWQRAVTGPKSDENYMVAAMGQIVRYALWGYIGTERLQGSRLAADTNP
jgi:hypothetical protein